MQMYAAETVESHGEDLCVTSLERTMVDVMQRPNLAGSWEEVWRSLEMMEYFDLEAVCEYVEMLGNATTAAKVGFFLDQHREQLMVDEMYLDRLATLRPKLPHYLDRSCKGNSKFFPDWNLVVPNCIVERHWEKQ